MEMTFKSIAHWLRCHEVHLGNFWKFSNSYFVTKLAILEGLSTRSFFLEGSHMSSEQRSGVCQLLLQWVHFLARWDTLKFHLLIGQGTLLSIISHFLIIFIMCIKFITWHRATSLWIIWHALLKQGMGSIIRIWLLTPSQSSPRLQLKDFVFLHQNFIYF